MTDEKYEKLAREMWGHAGVPGALDVVTIARALERVALEAKIEALSGRMGQGEVVSNLRKRLEELNART